ncbi:MAG: macrolide family glycosyltransferase [Chloroflexota bacterium]
MSKALFFSIPASGHVNPSLPLTAELVRRGEQIISYNTEAYRAKIEATGATFRAYTQIDDTFLERHNLDGSNPPKAARVLIQLSREMLPDLIAIVRAEQPDYILYDSMCPWGALVARICGVPSVVSVALMIFDTGMLLRSAGVQTLLPMMIAGVPDILSFNLTSRALGRQYHIKPLKFTEFFNAPGDLMISYTMPPIQPPTPTLDAHIQFVGPSIAPRGDLGDFPMQRLDVKPVIYISLGTVRNDNLAFFQKCIQAFAATSYTVVMSIGAKVDSGALGAIPANFIVRPYNPQLEILQHTSLFITHAGMNSVHEGLYYNVPLLLVPQQPEQDFVALRIQELGAGLKLTVQTPDTIRQSAERILRNASYQQKAAELGAILRGAGGASRGADLILAMVRKSQPSGAE